MGNCLVTKLKASVENSDLHKMDEFFINVVGANSKQIGFIWNDGTTFEQGVEFSEGLTYTKIAASYATVSGSGTIKVKNKYNLTLFNDQVSNGIALEELYYSPLNVFSISGITFPDANSIVLKLNGLTVLQVGQSQTPLRIENVLKHKETLSNFIFNYNNFVKGSMFEYGRLKSLTSGIGVAYNRGITGSIEDFVAGRVFEGQASSPSTVSFYDGESHSITFNDAELPHIGSTNLTWSASGNNTVITYGSNSTTIHVNSDGTWTRVS